MTWLGCFEVCVWLPASTIPPLCRFVVPNLWSFSIDLIAVVPSLVLCNQFPFPPHLPASVVYVMMYDSAFVSVIVVTRVSLWTWLRHVTLVPLPLVSAKVVKDGVRRVRWSLALESFYYVSAFACTALAFFVWLWSMVAEDTSGCTPGHGGVGFSGSGRWFACWLASKLLIIQNGTFILCFSDPVP